MNVLTMGHWPNYPIMEVSIPPLLCEFQQVFAKFYTSKHNGRKLQWQYSLASAILKGTFKPKVCDDSLPGASFVALQVQKELDVSLFQAMVLLMFNDKTEWCYDEIKECTKIGVVFRMSFTIVWTYRGAGAEEDPAVVGVWKVPGHHEGASRQGHLVVR